MVGDNPVKFGGNRHCGSGRIMVLVCPMIPKDHVTQELSNSMRRSAST